MNNCTINDTNSKLLDLINFSFEITPDLDNNLNISLSTFWLIGFITSTDTLSWVMKFFWIYSFAMNCFKIAISDFNSADNNTEKSTEIYYRAMNFIFIILCGIFLFVWLSFKYATETKIQKMKYDRIQESDFNSSSSWFESVKRFFSIYILYSIIYNSIPMTCIFHITFCFLDLYVSLFFVTMHLWLIIYQSETLKYAIRSITEHWNQLAMTFMLVIFIIFSYSVILGSHFSDTFSDNSEELGTI